MISDKKKYFNNWLFCNIIFECDTMHFESFTNEASCIIDGVMKYGCLQVRMWNGYDVTAFVMDWMTESSFEWAFLLRSEEDEFELMSSTEPIFKLKPRDLRGAVLRGWGPQREAEFCVLSLPTSPHQLDLDCKLTTSFIRERLNDIITQSQPQSGCDEQDNWDSEQREELESKSQWHVEFSPDLSKSCIIYQKYLQHSSIWAEL